MWPVMTLTLLLQLTDEEQLFAQEQLPRPTPATVEHEVLPAPGSGTEDCAAWPLDDLIG